MTYLLHALFWHASGRALYGVPYWLAALIALGVGAALLWRGGRGRRW